MAGPALPAHLRCYKSTPVFTESTIPAGLVADHATKAGVWGVIRVEAGRLLYEISGGQSYQLDVATPGVIAPEVKHRVEPIGCVRFRVEFFR
jgi:tellurite methyltransferase